MSKLKNICSIVLCIIIALSAFAYDQVSNKTVVQNKEKIDKISAQKDEYLLETEANSAQYILFEEKQKKLDSYIKSITKSEKIQFNYSDKSYPDSFGGSFVCNKEPFICIVQGTLPSDKVLKYAKDEDIRIVYVKYSLNQLNATADNLVEAAEEHGDGVGIENIIINQEFNKIYIQIYQMSKSKVAIVKKLIEPNDMLEFSSLEKYNENKRQFTTRYFPKNTKINFNWKKADGAVKYTYKIINKENNKVEKFAITKATSGFFNTPNSDIPAIYHLYITALDSENKFADNYVEIWQVEEFVQPDYAFVGLNTNKIYYSATNIQKK